MHRDEHLHRIFDCSVLHIEVFFLASMRARIIGVEPWRPLLSPRRLLTHLPSDGLQPYLSNVLRPLHSSMSVTTSRETLSRIEMTKIVIHGARSTSIMLWLPRFPQECMGQHHLRQQLQNCVHPHLRLGMVESFARSENSASISFKKS